MKARFVVGVAAVLTTTLLSGCATPKAVPLYNPAEVMEGRHTLLEVPPELKLLALDGEPIDKDIQAARPSNRPTLLALAPGRHSIRLMYDVIIDNAIDTGDFVKFRSRPLSAEWTAEPGLRYRVEHSSVRVTASGSIDDSDLSVLIAPAGKVKASELPAPQVDLQEQEQTPDPEPVIEEDAPDDLKKAWNEASPEERKAFLNKVLE